MCRNGKSDCFHAKDKIKKEGEGWTVGPCSSNTCADGKIMMCRDGKTDCFKSNDVAKKEKEGWVTGPCFSSSQNVGGIDQSVTEIQIEPIAKALTIKAFPNPTNSYFTLNMRSLSTERVQVKVFDLVGREVFTANGTANETYRFGEKFARGNYLVRVLQGDKQATAKLSKQ